MDMNEGMKNVESPEDLSHEDLSRFLIDLFHRTLVHYGLWFNEVVHQFGMERALEAMRTARDRSYQIQMDRLAQLLGFEMENGVPKAASVDAERKVERTHKGRRRQLVG